MKRGFTLLEVVIALLIVGILATGLLPALASLTKASLNSELIYAAPGIAQTTLAVGEKPKNVYIEKFGVTATKTSLETKDDEKIIRTVTVDVPNSTYGFSLSSFVSKVGHPGSSNPPVPDNSPFPEEPKYDTGDTDVVNLVVSATDTGTQVDIIPIPNKENQCTGVNAASWFEYLGGNYDTATDNIQKSVDQSKLAQTVTIRSGGDKFINSSIVIGPLAGNQKIELEYSGIKAISGSWWSAVSSFVDVEWYAHKSLLDLFSPGRCSLFSPLLDLISWGDEVLINGNSNKPFIFKRPDGFLAWLFPPRYVKVVVVARLENDDGWVRITVPPKKVTTNDPTYAKTSTTITMVPSEKWVAWEKVTFKVGDNTVAGVSLQSGDSTANDMNSGDNIISFGPFGKGDQEIYLEPLCLGPENLILTITASPIDNKRRAQVTDVRIFYKEESNAGAP